MRFRTVGSRRIVCVIVKPLNCYLEQLGDYRDGEQAGKKSEMVLPISVICFLVQPHREFVSIFCVLCHRLKEHRAFQS